ncbi:hypothetical protein DFH08DRAFT_801929 [Mycena albidolilacea]|uniref:Uncharacterized protein n=1 Tax=Mycena albidolilacea TaxID=1033008 RepID=A0AAD7AHK9_9AGAR|nr:hypothetical protein DFH08DRAFT_801929 [Mycena albidolilacea]
MGRVFPGVGADVLAGGFGEPVRGGGASGGMVENGCLAQGRCNCECYVHGEESGTRGRGGGAFVHGDLDDRGGGNCAGGLGGGGGVVGVRVVRVVFVHRARGGGEGAVEDGIVVVEVAALRPDGRGGTGEAGAGRGHVFGHLDVVWGGMWAWSGIGQVVGRTCMGLRPLRHWDSAVGSWGVSRLVVSFLRGAKYKELRVEGVTVRQALVRGVSLQRGRSDDKVYGAWCGSLHLSSCFLVIASVGGCRLARGCWCRPTERTASTTGERDDGGVGKERNVLSAVSSHPGSWLWDVIVVVPPGLEMSGSGTKTWSPVRAGGSRVRGRSSPKMICVTGDLSSFRWERARGGLIYWATYTLLRGWRAGILNSLQAAWRHGARRCTNVTGGDRCLYVRPGSGNQQASLSSTGGIVHPSQWRGKTGHCGGPEQGAPLISIDLHASEDAIKPISAAVSAADLIQEESGDSISRADLALQHLRMHVNQC